MRPYRSEDDFWRIRSFLREVFLLNDCLEHSWHVARLDYWRWHLVLNCQFCAPLDQVTTLWETADGQLAAVLHPIVTGELRLHVHPHFRTLALEDAILAQGEQQLFATDEDGHPWVHLGVDAHDVLRHEALTRRGYRRSQGWSHRWQRDLADPLPEVPALAGYTIRSMGGLDEHPARSLASWRAFHSDEPEASYDGDWSWFGNVQAAPLYRRDLDIVAATNQGEIASFCTIYYDDCTRSAVCVLVGTAAAHWRRGLGKAVMKEGMRRLRAMGCLRVFASAFDPPADALYGSMLQTNQLYETWYKELL